MGEKCVELLHQRPTGLCGKPGVAPERRHPPAMHLTTFWTNFDELPGPELFYPAQDRPRAHHVPEGNVLDKALRIELARHLRVLDEGLQAGGKHERFRAFVVEERFLAETIAHQP